MARLNLRLRDEYAPTAAFALLEFLHAPLGGAGPPLDGDRIELQVERRQLEDVVDDLSLPKPHHPRGDAVANGPDFDQVGAGPESSLGRSEEHTSELQSLA